MPPTLTAPSPTTTAHPVLVEVVETRLMWIYTDTPGEAVDQAAALATEADPRELRSMRMPVIDRCIEARAVTEDLADWLDADSDDVERLDAYFAARNTE
jgi:hypothetical protein